MCLNRTRCKNRRSAFRLDDPGSLEVCAVATLFRPLTGGIAAISLVLLVGAAPIPILLSLSLLNLLLLFSFVTVLLAFMKALGKGYVGITLIVAFVFILLILLGQHPQAYATPVLCGLLGYALLG